MSGFLSKEIRDFYGDKSVLVIGGAGFIGQQLTRLLALTRANVIVVDDFSRGTTQVPLVQYVNKDVAASENFSEMYDLFAWADVVFNLAARVAGVLHNQSHHLNMYYSNVRVQVVPVEIAEEAYVPIFLQTSSVCVYSPEHNSPSVEIHGFSGIPHPANAGYAEAKRDGERAVLWASGIGKAVIVRPSNVAGPGDYFDDRAHVIPAFVARAARGPKKFTLYGDPYTTREFIHPQDVANGMMYAAAFGEHREAYNIGWNGETTIAMKDLAEKIIDKCLDRSMEAEGVAIGLPELVIDKSVGGGDPRRWSDSRKLNALGWEPAHSLDAILDHCIDDFYVNHYPQPSVAYG